MKTLLIFSHLAVLILGMLSMLEFRKSDDRFTSSYVYESDNIRLHVLTNDAWSQEFLQANVKELELALQYPNIACTDGYLFLRMSAWDALIEMTSHNDEAPDDEVQQNSKNITFMRL